MTRKRTSLMFVVISPVSVVMVVLVQPVEAGYIIVHAVSAVQSCVRAA
jgi:hypothetical protein